MKKAPEHIQELYRINTKRHPDLWMPPAGDVPGKTSGLFGLKTRQLLHETALAAGGIIAVQNALNRGPVQRTNRFQRCFAGVFQIATFHKGTRFLDLSARAGTENAVALAFFL